MGSGLFRICDWPNSASTPVAGAGLFRPLVAGFEFSSGLIWILVLLYRFDMRNLNVRLFRKCSAIRTPQDFEGLWVRPNTRGT